MQASKIYWGALVFLSESRSEDPILFKFNPGVVQRSASPSMVGGEPGDHSGAVRFTGPPIQTIRITMELDAETQLSPPADDDGVYPILYTVEQALYPDISGVQQNQERMAWGEMDIRPYEPPETRVVLGPNNVLNVRLVAMLVEEQMFDQALAPLRATVHLTLQLLDDRSASEESAALEGFHEIAALHRFLNEMPGRT